MPVCEMDVPEIVIHGTEVSLLTVSDREISFVSYNTAANGGLEKAGTADSKHTFFITSLRGNPQHSFSRRSSTLSDTKQLYKHVSRNFVDSKQSVQHQYMYGEKPFVPSLKQ